jgi:hypothetical protein
MERRFRVWQNVTTSGQPNNGQYCVGDIISLDRDDGSWCPAFHFADGLTHYVFMHNIEEIDRLGRVMHRFDVGSSIANPILIPVSNASLIGETLSARRKRLLMK